MRALGIDCGTSGLRAALIDAAGEPIAQASVRYASGSERDPASWARALREALALLSREADPASAEAVAIDGTSGTLVALGEDGEPLAASLYDEPAEADDVTAVAAVAPANSPARGATSPLARARALSRCGGVVRLAHQADWLAALLHGGEPVADENNALKTGYDPLARRWPDWVARVLDPALLPRVVPAGLPIGTVAHRAARALGLRPGAVIVAGTTDSCAAFLAAGASEPGEGVTSLGSTLAVKLLSPQPVADGARGVYSHRVAGAWLAGGASNTGGAVLARFFDHETIARLSARIDPARPSGLDYYPLLAPGERFPRHDPTLAPRLAPRPADDALFLQGLLEGIARIEAEGYRALAELGAPALRSVRTAGGGARNPTWTAIRARILGVPVLPAACEEAAVGAARLALDALRRRSPPPPS
ncbi:MAG: FGGY-family carbohydrate kinase [Elioraea sp.]|nr:FGGY-family carbohydrate kinase [Elioraea sp.]